MTCTEEEAKKKLCPLVAAHDPQRDLAMKSFHHSQVCVGSACMAWRWVTPKYKDSGGFCGIAGECT